jgi:hypothetical protein
VRIVQLRVFAFACASLAAFPANAIVVTVSPTAGEVRVGSGQGFHPIVVPTEVAAGARVMVGPNGAASIAYSESCVVTAPAAAITIVQSRPPCATMPEPSYFGFAQGNEEGFGTMTISSESYGFTPKVDAPDQQEAPAPSAGRKQQTRPVPVEERSGDHHGLLIVGGVVVGAGVLAAALASQGDDDPASP